MGTWPVLAIPFPPCLSRKRQSWEHGVCLRFPFPPSCRGNDNHGNTPCACETLFPLPDKEKAVVGCLRFAFPFACRRKGLPRDSAGLRGWGAHGALQGPEGLRRALQGFRRCGITRDRPKWRFSTTGTRNMTFSIRVCALVMAFSLCLSRKRPSQVSPRRLKSALGLPRLRTAPKPVKIELFSLGLWRASDTE